MRGTWSRFARTKLDLVTRAGWEEWEVSGKESVKLPSQNYQAKVRRRSMGGCGKWFEKGEWSAKS